MSGTALATRQSTVDEMISLGKLFAASGLFSDLKGEAQAIVKIKAGEELGVPAFASVNGIHIIQGKLSISAGMMATLIKRHPNYNYRIKEHTDDTCSIEFFEGGESVGVSEFTKADAVKAKTQNMNKVPRNMLFARAISNGAKWFCPDVFGGPVYTPEEMGAKVDADGEAVSYEVVQPPHPLTEEMLEMHKEDRSPAEIAKELDVSLPEVLKVIKG